MLPQANRAARHSRGGTLYEVCQNSRGGSTLFSATISTVHTVPSASPHSPKQVFAAHKLRGCYGQRADVDVPMGVLVKRNRGGDQNGKYNEQSIGHPGLPGQNADAAVEEREKKIQTVCRNLSEWPILYTKALSLCIPPAVKPHNIIEPCRVADGLRQKLLHGAPFPDQTFTPIGPRLVNTTSPAAGRQYILAAVQHAVFLQRSSLFS